MAGQQRIASEADIYHIIVRGAGRQLIFEDEDDCKYFLGILKNLLADMNASVYAWCLMGNHVHLLLHIAFEDMPILMQQLCRSYAQYFNKRYDRVGHLMQGRYKSVPISTDEQLIATVRYIHFNPVKAEIDSYDNYRWSSYKDYLKQKGITDTTFVIDLVGGINAFKHIHDGSFDDNALAKESAKPLKMTDASAKVLLNKILESMNMPEIPLSNKAERNCVIAKLRQQGLSIRQIERLTGISRGVISSVKKPDI